VQNYFKFFRAKLILR